MSRQNEARKTFIAESSNVWMGQWDVSSKSAFFQIAELVKTNRHRGMSVNKAEKSVGKK